MILQHSSVSVTQQHRDKGAELDLTLGTLLMQFSGEAAPESGLQFTNRPCPSATLFFHLVPTKSESSFKCNCSLPSIRSMHTALQ